MSLTTGINAIDSLVSSSWNSKAGTPVALTYSFLTSVPADATATDAKGFMPMNSVQEAAVRAAMDQWSAVANVTFTEVAQGGNIQIGTNDQGSTSGGYAYLPDGIDPIYLYTNNQDSYNFNFTPGTYGVAVLIHELGHTLGFKHPGNYDSTGSTIDGPYLPAATDNLDYSQMSYNVGSGFNLNGLYGTTPMLYDIQAMQYLYGANMNYHTGNDTYSFVRSSPLQCIWDAGGTDTFDFSACRSATVINLNAGSFSSTAPGYNNISIAYNVTIEHAIAGSGGSTIYANDAGDVITGGAGNDVVYEGAGSDHISGNGGSDTVVFSKALSAYDFTGSTGNLVVSGGGTDTLSGIATLKFSDATIQLAQYTLMAGTANNDVLTVAGTNELISGGAGVDVLTVNGREANYKLAASGSAVTMTDLTGTGGTDLLTGVERVQFSDGWLALDTSGSAGQLYRLYEAMFNRAPDAAGMGYWLDTLDHGNQLVNIATGFVTSKEFNDIYGANATNTDFVTALYHNVLHREPDQAGLDFWVTQSMTAGGWTRAQVLVGFSDSAENIAVMAPVIPVGVAYTPWHG